MARNDGLPPRPYEETLSRLLTSAFGRTVDGIEIGVDGIEVEVKGRAAYLGRPDDDEWTRMLVPEELITLGIALSAGYGQEAIGVEIKLLPWDATVGARPVDDGRSWLAGDGQDGHWCLDPSSCSDLRRRLED